MFPKIIHDHLCEKLAPPSIGKANPEFVRLPKALPLTLSLNVIKDTGETFPFDWVPPVHFYDVLTSAAWNNFIHSTGLFHPWLSNIAGFSWLRFSRWQCKILTVLEEATSVHPCTVVIILSDLSPTQLHFRPLQHNILSSTLGQVNSVWQTN